MGHGFWATRSPKKTKGITRTLWLINHLKKEEQPVRQEKPTATQRERKTHIGAPRQKMKTRHFLIIK